MIEWTDSFSRTCALAVGINKYKTHDPLKNAVNDAKAEGKQVKVSMKLLAECNLSLKLIKHFSKR